MGTKHKTENELFTERVLSMITKFHRQRMTKFVKDFGINNSVFIRSAIIEKLKREGYLSEHE